MLKLINVNKRIFVKISPDKNWLFIIHAIEYWLTELQYGTRLETDC
jgi:hypothetical protein